jgi:hypothetical protein
LHWLPVNARIDYKILNTTWKALHKESPGYISGLLKPITHNRDLRSKFNGLLETPQTLTKLGERAFCHIAPKLWNKLPQDIRLSSSNEVFKKKLKTHLFHHNYLNP